MFKTHTWTNKIELVKIHENSYFLKNLFLTAVSELLNFIL